MILPSSNHSLSQHNTMDDQTVSAISGNGRLANSVHGAVFIIVAGMVASIIYAYEPLYCSLINNYNWGGVIYLITISALIVAYWPSLIYRMIIILALTVPGIVKKHKYTISTTGVIPPVSIIIAVRNEPASIVIPLIRSLSDRKCADYEIVIADNSDVVLDDGSLNRDFLQIAKFAEGRGVRMCRRDSGPHVSESLKFSNWRVASLRAKGNVEGGKAANLNLAIRSSDKKFKWFMILDADSLLPDLTMHQLLTIGISGNTCNRSVGFVQSVLLSRNDNESSVSYALSLTDELYYRAYFKVKASFGVVSNFGHGVLVSREAWQATKGFPLEISEDLAWANKLALTGKFINYYAECHTFEGKPINWRALKVQRDRWAKGTTLLLKKQLLPIWKAKNLRFSEKMDLSYDMMSYAYNAVGCLIPILFMGSGVLGPDGVIVFKTLIPIFYFSLLIDNILLPLCSLRMALDGDVKKAWKILKAVPMASIYIGGISSQIFSSVGKAMVFGRFLFQITPKEALI